VNTGTAGGFLSQEPVKISDHADKDGFYRLFQGFGGWCLGGCFPWVGRARGSARRQDVAVFDYH
ncbi:hypothetical protein, partial [Pseudomonas gessardii]|uniref:hypothetical protein n=1 Tax=Pseudomonas gessardii TaxID=78544 RepID=UPI001F34939F